jgi:hypothetical protein
MVKDYRQRFVGIKGKKCPGRQKVGEVGHGLPGWRRQNVASKRPKMEWRVAEIAAGKGARSGPAK